MKKKPKRKKTAADSAGVKTSSYQKEWLYMSPDEITLSAIKEALESYYSVEYWEIAGVVEIELAEASSIDFETVEMERADDAARAYMRDHQVQTVFLVTIQAEEFAIAEKAMKQLIASEGGFFCGDTADFTPVVS